MWLLCVLPIFVILYGVISGSLQRSALFGKNATVAVALERYIPLCARPI